jgi:hypothetical protein
LSESQTQHHHCLPLLLLALLRQLLLRPLLL